MTFLSTGPAEPDATAIFADEAPGRLYLVWADLTDRWNAVSSGIERRSEADGLLGAAVAELLAIDDDPSGLDDYLTRLR